MQHLWHRRYRPPANIRPNADKQKMNAAARSIATLVEAQRCLSSSPPRAPIVVDQPLAADTIALNLSHGVFAAHAVPQLPRA